MHLREKNNRNRTNGGFCKMRWENKNRLNNQYLNLYAYDFKKFEYSERMFH